MAISAKHLESKIRILNEVTNNPVEPYSELLKSNVGHYHLYQAYGCFYLNQIVNEHGAENDIFYAVTKRELYKQISAMIDGIRIGKNCVTRGVA